MSPWMARCPDAETLAEDLQSILTSARPDGGRIAITDRRSNWYATMSASEIITCRLGDGSQLTLLCKYSVDRGHDDHGHRGGGEYEADVYRHVLQRLPLTSPRFYGWCTRRGRSNACLVVEFVDDSWRINRAPVPDGIHAAARWIGEFHAIHDAEPPSDRLSFLTHYDSDYYYGWARRAAEIAAQAAQAVPWINAVCDRFDEWARHLLQISLTVIHGEYTMQNVLFRDGDVYPVDWESAAVAAGEIDVAALVDGWPDDIVSQCVDIYQRARWPHGPPAGFSDRCDAARLYWALRWLGSEKAWSLEKERSDEERYRKLSEYSDDVRDIGLRLGLISQEMATCEPNSKQNE